MSVKLLISGESNSGKTTLTKTLQNALVVSHDGKKYSYAVPHVMVDTFDSIQELINLTNDKIVAYKEKFNVYPKTVVFDSVSKIFDTMLDNCNTKFTGFTIYSNLNKEIHEFTEYVQNTLIASDMNVVLISHALYDADTAKYNLIGKGDFAKRGGFLSETDQALFIETKASKRILHFRSTKFPARTLRDEDPDSVSVDDFNLQTYIETLAAEQSDVDDHAL
ncbi:MAG: AAA family ATPase [Sulfuricurvum sp.]